MKNKSLEKRLEQRESDGYDMNYKSYWLDSRGNHHYTWKSLIKDELKLQGYIFMGYDKDLNLVYKKSSSIKIVTQEGLIIKDEENNENIKSVFDKVNDSQ